MRNGFKIIICALIVLCVVLIIAVSQSQSFRVDRLNYIVSDTGDAYVIANYKLTFVEKVWLLFPMTKDGITRAIKTEYGEDAVVILISDTNTKFTIPKFADKYDTYIQTPFLTFENVKKRTNDIWFMRCLNIDYSPTLTNMIFHNGEIHTYNEAMSIPAITVKF